MHPRAAQKARGVSTRRKRLDIDERRAQLLDLARKAFASRSYDDVSIDALAQAAGVSKGLLYHYFPSKRELYIATVQVGAQKLMEQTVPDPALSPRDQVFAGVGAYLRFVEENGSTFKALMQSGIGRDQETYAIVEGVRRRFVEVTVERMGAATVTPIQRTLVRGWVGMVEAASLEWLEHKRVSREELTRLLVKTLLYTLQLAIGKK